MQSLSETPQLPPEQRAEQFRTRLLGIFAMLLCGLSLPLIVAVLFWVLRLMVLSYHSFVTAVYWGAS